mmetsp:Transcript_36656/g.67199  ORF Transcript_36656/g.67199 Transcript_36656/m.67199 type:complete len:676 (-) Transcript_36656:79-2106(-)
MANWGALGPPNALVPFGPVPTIKEKDKPESTHTSLLEELGLINGPREQVKRASDDEFQRLVGQGDALTEEMFVAAAQQLFGMERRCARACFHASDLGKNARLDVDEYLLFREAFVNPLEHEKIHAEIRKIQLSAVYYKYIVSRPAIRWLDREGNLTKEEVFEWMRDLCSGDSHVEGIANEILPLLQAVVPPSSPEGNGKKAALTLPKVPTFSLEQFVQGVEQGLIKERMDSLSLNFEDLISRLKGTGRRHQYLNSYSRVVLDGRAETVHLKSGKKPTHIKSDIVPADAVNSKMKLDNEVRAVGGWRGPQAAGRDGKDYKIAWQVIEYCTALSRATVREEDVLDSDWRLNNSILDKMFGRGQRKQAEAICNLADACRLQLAAQASLVRVTAPCKLFGDVHGQFRDLIVLFGEFGFPTHCGGDIQDMKYVFNGDFVDRGAHQLECVCLLFALKVVYPAAVFLLRGNHEFRHMSMHMRELGFLYHLQRRFPQHWEDVFEAVHDAFDWLPLAALVGGKVLVLHGGLGDGTWGLKDVEAQQRPMQDESESQITLDILWSDPSDSDDIMKQGVHKSPTRGEGVREWGPDVTANFCQREGISIIVRSHQFVRQGYKVMHSGRLLTLFSARNYFKGGYNDGAILLLAPDGNGHLRVHPKRIARFEPHPGGWLARVFGQCLPCI